MIYINGVKASRADLARFIALRPMGAAMLSGRIGRHTKLLISRETRKGL